jgi:hypothetical protein
MSVSCSGTISVTNPGLDEYNGCLICSIARMLAFVPAWPREMVERLGGDVGIVESQSCSKRWVSTRAGIHAKHDREL